MSQNRRLQADPTLCRDCQACTLACSLYHEGQCSLGLARLAVLKDMERFEFNILICQHCAAPECMAACPAEAMRLDQRGVVILDDEACTCCGSCAAACPHEAIFFHEAQERYLKCDLCQQRAEGPLCVTLCPVGALRLVEQEG